MYMHVSHIDVRAGRLPLCGGRWSSQPAPGCPHPITCYALLVNVYVYIGIVDIDCSCSSYIVLFKNKYFNFASTQFLPFLLVHESMVTLS